MKKLMVAMAAVIACAFAFAEDTPEAVVVEIDRTLVMTSQTDVDALAGKPLVLRGTLDLNGHDVSVLSLSCLTDDILKTTTNPPDQWAIGSTVAMITNSSPTVATFTVQGGSAYFTGRVSSGVNFTMNGGELQILTGEGAFAPAKFTQKKSTAMVFSRPADMAFKFSDVAADASVTNKSLRLSEVLLTYQGVPLEDYGRDVTREAQVPANWFNRNMTDHQFWNGRNPISAEKPACFRQTVGTSGNANSTGCPQFNGYRLTPPAEPAFAPTAWEVYVARSGHTGAILVDRRTDDPLNRPEIKPTTFDADKWSNRLSQNFEFNQLKLGNPFGENTDIELASGATMRVSTAEPFKVGAVSGAGTIQVDDGTVFAPKSLKDWTGKFTTKYDNAFGREAKVAVGDGVPVAAMFASNVTVVGGLSIDTGTEGVVDLARQGSIAAGETEVKSGTLRIRGKFNAVTCKQIRLAPKKVPNADNYYDYYWGMNEFAVYDVNGNAISLANATISTTAPNGWHSDSKLGKSLVDGNTGTRAMPKGGSKTQLPTVTFTVTEPITIASYDWYPVGINYRFPLELEVAVSMDGNTWTIVDYAYNAAPASYEAWVGGEGNRFALNGGATQATQMTLPEELTGQSSANAAFVECVKAKRIRFRPYETFFGGKFEGVNQYGWHVSEFSLMKDGQVVPWPAGTTVVCKDMLITAKTYGNAGGHFADNVHSGGIGNVDDAHRCFVDQCGGYMEVSLPADADPIEFDAYQLWNGSQTELIERLPRVWTVEASADGTAWTVIDIHAAGEDDVCVGVYEPYGPFSLKDRWPINGANNAIGDLSTVNVSAGATADFNTSYERIGGLAGLGSVYLKGTLLDLYCPNGASFSGKIEGAGVLSVSDTQTFADADLSGVTELRLNGGTVAGSASFEGKDLAIAFNGGTLGAELSNVGKVSVSGPVKYAFPTVAPDVKSASLQLISAAEISAAAQAAFAAGTVDVPRGWKYEVSVSATGVRLDVWKPGLFLIVK